MTPGLELTCATVRVGDRRVLEEVNLAAYPGEILGIIGANGAGKTTLLRAALGLAPLIAGEARLAGDLVRGMSDQTRARRVAYLPQDRRVGWNLPAWRIVALSRPHENPARVRRLCLEALTEVGLAKMAERGVLDMSGGERARVLLARLIATDVPVLVADEPVAGLDPDAQLQVMELLRARARSGTTVVLTLHDLTLAARGCDRLGVLSHGIMTAIGSPAETLTPDILDRAFAIEGHLENTEHGLSVIYGRKA